MATLNQIGDFTFISLTGPPAGLKESLAVELRSGVDGVSIWKLGRHGTPFAAVSVVDPLTKLAGEQLFRSYEALTDADPVSITWSDIFVQQILYKILDVRLIELKSMLLGRGGRNNGNFLLRAEWTLQPVQQQQP